MKNEVVEKLFWPHSAVQIDIVFEVTAPSFGIVVTLRCWGCRVQNIVGGALKLEGELDRMYVVIGIVI